MSSCTDIRPKIQLILDGELTAEEREDVMQHIAMCEGCEQELQEAEDFSCRIRASRPNLNAPDSLRQLIFEKIVASEYNRTPWQVSGPQLVPNRDFSRSWYVGAVAALILLVIGGTFVAMQRRDRPSEMLRAAVLEHRELQRNQVSLDVVTDSPENILEWFGKRVSFPIRMADAGIASNDRAKYKLVGGRLVNLEGEQAALLSFRLAGEMVSLLIASDRFDIDAGGNVVRSAGIDLHSRDEESMRVVSWKNRGLSYVLVFGNSKGRVNACGRCHEAGSSDRTTAE